MVVPLLSVMLSLQRNTACLRNIRFPAVCRTVWRRIFGF